MQVQFPIIRLNYYTAKSNMGRSPCCSGEHSGLKRGPWTHEEDQKLKTFLLHNPNTSWRLVPPGAGLLRCGKSCRLRWMNYLRPDIRRGNFTAEEETTIIRLHAAVGNKWSVIASQLPGRTDNEIKNLWNTKLRKHLVLKGINPITHQPLCNPLLSDYVKQWVKSIENVIIAGIMTQPSLSPTDNHLNNNASISSSSADVALPSEISSLPVDSQIPEYPTLSQPPPPFNAWSSHFTNSLFTSSFVDDHSLNKEDNSASNYLLEEGSSLFAGFSEYFKYEVEDNTSHALLDTEMSSVASAGELEEGLRYWE